MIGGACECGDRNRAVGSGDFGDLVLDHDVGGACFEHVARDLDELRAHLARRKHHRAPSDDEGATCKGAKAIGRAIGVAVNDADAFWRHADLVRDDLREGRAQTLSVR